MTRSRFERFLPIAGVVSAVLFFAAGAATQSEPRIDGKHPARYVDWAVAHHTQLVVSGVCGAYFVFFMLLFVIALRSTLRSGEAGESTFSTGALAGGLGVAMAIGFMSLLSLATAGAASAGDRTAVQTLAWMSGISFVTWAAGSGVLMLSVGFGGLRTLTLPKWLAITTAVLGVLSITGPTGIAVFLVTPLWLLVISVVLLRRQSSSRPDPARRAQPSFAG